LTDNYDVEALHLDTEPAKVLRSLEAFADYLREDGDKGKRHVNLLFWGLPGTGKTEFAKYLADRLSMGLLVKRASDLLSMWVGGTEHNIRDAFEEAERERSILFIDEADSMFINRETAVRSWETAQTNELLTQMENFRGILICCTNLLDHLDRAVVRRFAWKIQFNSLTGDGKARLFRKYLLSDGGQISPEGSRRLAAIGDLTAGDFRAVWDKYAFVPGSERKEETLIEELQREVAYRKGHREAIGFAD
jgi:SpoVK/Ycf46/Vps4 family AAA+-type ATPase